MTEDQFKALARWVTLEAKAIAHDKLGHHPNTVIKARVRASEAHREAHKLLVEDDG